MNLFLKSASGNLGRCRELALALPRHRMFNKSAFLKEERVKVTEYLYLSIICPCQDLVWAPMAAPPSAHPCVNAAIVASWRRRWRSPSCAARGVILVDNGAVYSFQMWMAERGLHLFQVRIRYTHEQIACLLKQMSALYLYFALKSLVCIWQNKIGPALFKGCNFNAYLVAH